MTRLCLVDLTLATFDGVPELPYAGQMVHPADRSVSWLPSHGRLDPDDERNTAQLMTILRFAVLRASHQPLNAAG